MRGRKNLELALNKLLGTRFVRKEDNAVVNIEQSVDGKQSMACQTVNTCFLQMEDNAVGDIEQSVDGKQSMDCQTVNTSDQACAFPSSSSVALKVQHSSLVSSNYSLNSHPSHLCNGVQTKLFSKDFTINFMTQLSHCLSKHFNHGLHVVGPITMPNGIQYDRIFNVGGGDCFFLSIAQGCRFFGVDINHIELRSRVGQWIQGHALLMQEDLGIQPIDLHDYMTRFPAPAQGWWSYLSGMDWVQWGIHVEQLGEWVGPLEVNPTNHVLEELGCDLRVNIYSPASEYVLGNEENFRADGVEKPIIMVMSRAGHYEWLRMKI